MSEEVNAVAAPQNTVAERKKETAPYRYAMYKVCKDCGKMYAISDNDVVYFVQKFGTVPVRCPDCRAHRRVNSDMTTEVKAN